MAGGAGMSSTRAEKNAARDWLLTREGWQSKGANLFVGNCIYCYAENKEPNKGYYKDSTGYYNCYRDTCTPGGKEASEMRREFNFPVRESERQTAKKTPPAPKAQAQARADKEAAEAKRRAESWEASKALWESSEPLTPEQAAGVGYLARKKITDPQALGELRITRSAAKIPHYIPDNLPQQVPAGTLLVPYSTVFPGGSGALEMIGVQAIYPDGGKYLLLGSRWGGRHLLRKPTKPDTVMYVCEGYATAYAILQSTPRGGVSSAGSSASLVKVANYFKTRGEAIGEDLQVVICLDNDGKPIDENKFGGWDVAIPDTPGTDYWDVWQDGGAVAVLQSVLNKRQHIERPDAPVIVQAGGLDPNYLFERYKIVGKQVADWDKAERQNYINAWLASQSVADTDTAAHAKMVRQVIGSVGYSLTTEAWYIYDGGAWRRASAAVIARLCQKLPAVRKGTEDKPPGLMPLADNRARAAAEHLAIISSIDDRHTGTELDGTRTEHLLNLPNGTLNLGTLKLQAHNPRDYITRQAPVPWDASAAEPTAFLQYLDDFTSGDAGVAKEVMRMLGACLCGNSHKEKFYILHGIGRNGKSTLHRILTALLGETRHGGYATVLPSEVLLPSAQRTGGHNEPLANIRGARAVWVTEPDRQAGPIAAGMLKRLTGGDSITASRKHEHEQTFYCVANLIMATNHATKQTDFSEAMRRRVRVMDCRLKLDRDTADPGVEAAIMAELPGVLKLIAREAGEYIRSKHKYIESDAISASTGAHEAANDIIGAAIDEIVEEDPGGKSAVLRVSLNKVVRLKLLADGQVGSHDAAARFARTRLIDETMERKGYRRGATIDRKLCWDGCREKGLFGETLKDEYVAAPGAGGLLG